MFESGQEVARHIEPLEGGELRPEQIQPNGVDLTLGALHEQTGPGHIGHDGKEIGERRELDPEGAYELDPGAYVAGYGEIVGIPEGHVGFVYPRSSLMRNSCMLHTAVWDAGYEGRGEGLLEVHRPVTIDAGARIAQLVLATADHEGVYDGDYQGER
jgi:deoxycytidine triphosphate deaminase